MLSFSHKQKNSVNLFVCNKQKGGTALINTLTLNPAIDKVLYLEKLEKNITNRIQDTAEVIGGKGTHVSINLNILGENSKAFGISHGKTGQRIIDALAQFGVDVRFIHRATPNSRTNYLLVEETGDCTIIAEKGVQLSNCDLQDILFCMKNEIQTNDYLVLSGDASNSPDSTVYNEILTELKDKKLKIFLDTSGESLKQCITESPFLIKPNLDELSTLCNRALTCDENDIISAIDSLAPYNIEIIAVSLGSAGSIIKTSDGIFKATPPDIRVINTIGCGDSFLSGLIYGIHNKLATIDMIQLATAVSAATAESSLSVGFKRKRALELISSVKVDKIR
jgi:1-phosphofructokinase family hexose kinase